MMKLTAIQKARIEAAAAKGWTEIRGLVLVEGMGMTFFGVNPSNPMVNSEIPKLDEDCE